MIGEVTRMTIEGIGRTGIAAKHETTTEGDNPFSFVLLRPYGIYDESYE